MYNLYKGYKKYMSEVEADKEVDKILNSIDKNGNNMIDYTGSIKLNNYI